MRGDKIPESKRIRYELLRKGRGLDPIVLAGLQLFFDDVRDMQYQAWSAQDICCFVRERFNNVPDEIRQHPAFSSRNLLLEYLRQHLEEIPPEVTWPFLLTYDQQGGFRFRWYGGSLPQALVEKSA